MVADVNYGLPLVQITTTAGGTTQSAKQGLVDGVYTKDGTPTCLGQVPMEYVRSDPQKGHLYRCRTGGCHLLGSRGGVLYCDDEVWEDPQAEHPAVRRPAARQQGVEGSLLQTPDD